MGRPPKKVETETLEPLEPTDLWDEVRWYPEDFACKCGRYCSQDVPIHPDIVRGLDRMAVQVPYDIVILAGVRCNDEHWRVSETNGVGHLVQPDGYACAADIFCTDENRKELLKLALEIFPRVGLGDSFLHVDLIDSPVNCWVYGLDER